MAEHHIQQDIVKWLKATCPSDTFIIHIPNGGYRKPAEANKLKAMGVKAGVPDLQVIISARHIKRQIGPLVLWFEVKANEKEEPSDDQVMVMEHLCRIGCRCFLVSSVEHVRQALEALDVPLRKEGTKHATA